MDGPGFDDPGPPIPTPVSRVRRAFTVAVLLTLVALQPAKARQTTVVDVT